MRLTLPLNSTPFTARRFLEPFYQSTINKSTYNEYQNNFIQRQPKYAVKLPGPGRTWSTKNKPLSDIPILAHLDGKYSVAGIGQWYPKFAALDIDSVPFERVLSIREELGLDESNSVIYNSESPDSHHIFFRPVYSYNPPTLKLLNTSLKEFCITM